MLQALWTPAASLQPCSALDPLSILSFVGVDLAALVFIALPGLL